VEVLLQSAAAWVEFLDGKHDRALLHLRTAADLEDSLEKHPMTPGPITPAREMLASLLLEVGEPKSALAEFEKALQRAPNRFNALYGAARAAEQAEDFGTARRYYEKLAAVVAPSGSRQAELSEAKAFLEKGTHPPDAGPASN
jgi:tetratricopeptide (TPR) repeat protein